MTSGQIVEQHSIEQIPEDERHGRPWSLFTLWFASNITVVAVITGSLAVSLNLSLGWSIFAILAGNLIGGVFMAYHSVQGPRMGLPQMIQSRAQFGSLGAVLPMIVTVLMYLGFQIEGNISFGDALAAQTGMSVNWALILFGFVGVLTALFGYRVIHSLSKLMTVVTGLIFLAFLVKIAADFGTVHLPPSHSTAASVLLAVSFSVSWQITWAPYVSDYSRYLPAGTSSARTFWYTYAGSVLTAVFAMLIGVLAAFAGGDAFASDPLQYLIHLLPGAAAWFWLLTVFGFGGASGPYGAFLTAHAAVTGRTITSRRIPRVRAAFVIVFGVVSTVLSIAASSSLLSTFSNITTFLLYLLVPWTAINLMDYFVIRRGSYQIAELLKWNGVYGTLRPKAVAIYLLAIAIQIPFVNSSLYEGYLARHVFGGADIAWIVGLAFSAVAYWVVARDAATGRSTTVSYDAVSA